jgi:hypothetical protein
MKREAFGYCHRPVYDHEIQMNYDQILLCCFDAFVYLFGSVICNIVLPVICESTW